MTPYRRMRYYRFLATVLYVNFFVLPNTLSSPISDSEGINSGIYFDDRFNYDCPAGWTETGTWCDNSYVVTKQCISNQNPNDRIENMVWCYFWASCQESVRLDPDPRRASCVPQPGKLLWRWATDKLKNAATLQCAKFHASGAEADAITVQVEHPADVSYPLLPILAELFYEAASYPIQMLDQSKMVLESGSFAFLAPIDFKQPLDFCVYTAVPLIFTWGLYVSNKKGPDNVTFTTDIVTFDRASSNTYLDHVSNSKGINPRANYLICPRGFEYSESWCALKNWVMVQCASVTDPQVTIRELYMCDWFAECQGSQEGDPPLRHASCVPKIQKLWRWATDKTKGAESLQCVNFQASGVQADAIGVKVENPAKVKAPPMPTIAEMFYQGASYPIEILSQNLMNLQDGYFAFIDKIDLSQPLQFCVSTVVPLILTWGLVNPTKKGLEDITYSSAIVTHDRTIDRAFDVSEGAALATRG